MKIIPLLSLFVLGLAACENKDHGHSHAPAPSPIVGTWKLLTGTLIEKGDTVITTGLLGLKPDAKVIVRQVDN